MEAWARLLSLLLFLTAVSISTALGVSPESDLNPTALAETTATYSRVPEVTSDVILNQAEPEAILQAQVRRQRQGRRCTIVNNQRRCMLTRPGGGTVVGRGEKKKQRV